MEVDLLEELLVDLGRIKGLNGHWEFEPIVEAQLKLPPLLYNGLLLLVYLSLVLNNLCCLRYVIKSIVISTIEEEHAGFLQ